MKRKYYNYADILLGYGKAKGMSNSAILEMAYIFADGYSAISKKFDREKWLSYIFKIVMNL